MDGKMIDSGEALRPGALETGEEMIDALLERARAGDARAHAALLELAESMLIEGALGLPTRPLPGGR